VRRLFESGEPWFAAAETLLIGVAVALVIGLLIRYPARRVLGDDQRAQHTALMAIWGVVAIFGLMAIVRLFGGAAAEAGLTAAGNRLFGSVPDLLVALVIVALGFIAATAARTALGRALHDVSPDRAGQYGTAAATVVMTVSVLLAASQIGIQTRLAEAILLIVLGAALLAAALAGGLGGRGLAAAVAASRHIRSILHVGDEVEIDGLSGTVLNLGPTSVRLRCDDAVAEVPNSAFLTAVVRIHTTSETTRAVPVTPSERSREASERSEADRARGDDALFEEVPEVDDDAPTRTLPGRPMEAAEPSAPEAPAARDLEPGPDIVGPTSPDSAVEHPGGPDFDETIITRRPDDDEVNPPS
jgi:hypothetical protein